MPADTPDRDEQKAREIVAAWVPADHPGLTRAIASALREARQQERERCLQAVDKAVGCGCENAFCEIDVTKDDALAAIRSLEE